MKIRAYTGSVQMFNNDHTIIQGAYIDMSTGDLIYKLARDYYQKEMTQQEIAAKYGLSRIKVSRLLQQGRQEGIVEISLKAPASSRADTEARLADRFGLEEIILADTDGEREILPALGAAAVDYFLRSVEGNETVALTWGTALSAFVQALPVMKFPAMRIVQMLGGLGSPEAEFHGSDLVGRMAARMQASGRILPAPGIVSSAAVREALLKDANIAEGLSRAASADIALVGLGIASADSVLMREGNILTPAEAERLKKAGAVGDISLRFFDAAGNAVPDALDERVIGLSIDEIRRIPRVIAIAGGPAKRRAIGAALRGKTIDVLITDAATGAWLLETE